MGAHRTEQAKRQRLDRLKQLQKRSGKSRGQQPKVLVALVICGKFGLFSIYKMVLRSSKLVENWQRYE